MLENMPAPLPRTVGKYQILDRVAVGGMAELFKARVTGDHGFEKMVAIKKILPHLAADTTFVDMFFDEARLTARLDHPGIVQVFELGTDADTPYIAMQYIDGLDVLGLMRECARTQIRLPAALAVYIAHEVLDALDFAHHARDADGRPLGVVHRDVSPGNILIGRHGNVKLTDFGIARAAERKHRTETGMLKGKYGYMSPEQVQGNPLDGRSDLFSVGVVLAEMIMSRRLFAASSDLDVLLLVRDACLYRLAKYADDFPKAVKGMVERALSREPDERWATAADFRDALGGWLADQGTIGDRSLAAFVNEVRTAPTVCDPDELVDDGDDRRDAMTGPSTHMSAARASAEAAAARAAYLAQIAAPDFVDEHSSSGFMLVEEADLAGPGRAPPAETGDLRTVSAIRLLTRLARQHARGLLVLEGRAGILKEAFFADGHPQFVSSNVQSERLGEFLVREGAISSTALARALTVMPHFGGQLADTLVGLGLLRPLDAFRLLARQVSAKLTEACSWGKGRYRWFPDRDAPPGIHPLHLDAFRIVGAGAASLDVAFVDDWADGNARALVVAEHAEPGELDAFGLGAALERVHAMLDGRSTVGDQLARVRSPDARTNFLRLLYLLAETDLARLSHPAPGVPVG
jgi:serine/threonine protein kinase